MPEAGEHACNDTKATTISRALVVMRSIAVIVLPCLVYVAIIPCWGILYECMVLITLLDYCVKRNYKNDIFDREPCILCMEFELDKHTIYM